MKKIITTIQLKLKPRQKEILKLLYRFHHLNRKQIQEILKHKQFNRIIIWLNELTKQRYLARDFEKKLGNVAAVYSLDKNAKKILEKEKDISVSSLTRVYRDRKNSAKFKKHCVCLADIYLSLIKLTKKSKAKLSFYTKTDLDKTEYLISPYPDAYFAIEDNSKNIKRYFLDIFNPLDSPKWLHKRTMQYFDYYNKEDWQNNTDKPFPEVLMICPDEEYKKDLEKFIKKMLKRNIADLFFYLSTWGEIQKQGMNSKVLHKVEME